MTSRNNGLLCLADTCALSSCIFPGKNGVQLTCPTINLLYLDRVELAAGLDLCGHPASVTIHFSEDRYHVAVDERFIEGECSHCQQQPLDTLSHFTLKI